MLIYAAVQSGQYRVARAWAAKIRSHPEELHTAAYGDGSKPWTHLPLVYVRAMAALGPQPSKVWNARYTASALVHAAGPIYQLHKLQCDRAASAHGPSDHVLGCSSAKQLAGVRHLYVLQA